MRVGFLGLGTMGAPMALNLARAGTPLTVWNRTRSRCAPLAAAGATVADTPADVIAGTDVTFLMLANAESTEAVLQRATTDFRGRTVVNMGTVDPHYSRQLAADITRAGGRYVEAPVSGSQTPAVHGELVGMVAGTAAEEIEPLLKPLCHVTFLCGEVPNALLMKLAVNLYLITMVTGLAEATHFAERHDLDLPQFEAILAAGPMASSVSRGKTRKLITNDFTVQASVANVLDNNRLVAQAARRAGIASPLLDVCHALYAEAPQSEDMVAVLRAIERRSATR